MVHTIVVVIDLNKIVHTIAFTPYGQVRDGLVFVTNFHLSYKVTIALHFFWSTW
jgi:hypothetical protein